MPEYTCDVCGRVTSQNVYACPECNTPFDLPPTLEHDRGVPAPDNSSHHEDSDRGVAERDLDTYPKPIPATMDEADNSADSWSGEDRPLDVSPKPLGLLSLLISPFGRIGRLGYVLGMLFVASLSASALLAGLCTLPLGADEEAGAQIGRVVTIITLAAMMPLLIKRFHDIDVSGWGTLAVFLCGALILPIIALLAGSRGENRFGRPARLRWNPFSAALALILLCVGCYSAVITVELIALEQTFETAWAEHDRAPSARTQQEMRQIYQDAVWCRKWFPYYANSTAVEMYSSWAYGEALYEQQKWERSAEWLEKSVSASERLRGASTVREYESDFAADIVNVRLAFADALEAAGNLDRAVDVRAAIADKLSQRTMSTGINKSTELSTKGSVFLDQEKYDKAQAVFTELIGIDEARLAANSDDQELRSALGGSIHNRALARFNVGDLDGAQADLRKAIELQTVAFSATPRPSQCSEYLGLHHELLGQLHEQRRNFNAALEEYEKACEINPTSIPHRWRAAWTRYDRLEFDRIVELLDDFLSDAEDVHLEYLLAVSLLQEDRDLAASQVIDRLRLRHPGSVQGHFLSGVMKMMKGENDDAVASLSKAYSQKPGDRAILFNLSISLARADQHPEAQRMTAELFYVDSVLAERVRRYVQDGNDQGMQPMLELSYN